ncbi:hypothetical protein J7L60_02195 [Candidatus Bathyarchaeota archaeon]|nr:hypothetical protein [Candidatus Bathyarchaeota archaeon]
MENFRALFFTQGDYGERIFSYIASEAPPHWSLKKIRLPRGLSDLVEESEGVVRGLLPDEGLRCDLLVFLGESPSSFSLLPEVLERVQARSLIAPADDYAWLPLGLERQLRSELGLPAVFPRPFCSLTEVGEPVIDEFARFFGRPRLRVRIREGVVEEVEVLRGAPCGSTRYMAERLVGTPVGEAPRRASLLVQTYPCLASRRIEKVINDSLIHISGQIIKRAVEEALRRRLGYR